MQEKFSAVIYEW